MKQFMAFYGRNYYPSGGMDDFIGDYDTKEDALAAINKKNEDYPPYDTDDTDDARWNCAWAHIYDTKNRAEVWNR